MKPDIWTKPNFWKPLNSGWFLLWGMDMAILKNPNSNVCIHYGSEVIAGHRVHIKGADTVHLYADEEKCEKGYRP